jgi:uroporphyrinogen-III decarboxylase
VTPRERLLAAYRGGKPDRVPVFVRGVYPYSKRHVERAHPSFRPLIELVREQCEQVDFVGYDRGFLFTHPSAYKVTEETISDSDGRRVIEYTLATPKGPITERVTFAEGQPSMVTKHWVTADEDLARALSVPYVSPEPDVSEWREHDRILGDRGVSLMELSNAVGLVHGLLGSEEMAIWSMARREELVGLIRTMNGRVLDYMGKLMDAGVGPVIAMSGEELVTPPLHGPKDFNEFVVPFDREVVGLIHSKGRIARIHCHGPILQALDGFLDIGVDALHPVEAPPLGNTPAAEFRRRVGNRICMKGNIQIGDLFTLDASEIREQVRRLIDDCGRDGALIVAPTASPYISELTPRALDNYRAMVDAAHEFGRC